MATSHFYHDSYFRRFRSVYNLRLLLLTFDLCFVTSKLQWLQQLAPRSEGVEAIFTALDAILPCTLF